MISNHIPVLIIVFPLFLAFVLPLLGFAGLKFRNFSAVAVLLIVNGMLLSLISDVSLDGKVLYYVLGAADPAQFSPQGLDFPVRIVLKIDGFSLFTAIIVAVVSLRKVSPSPQVM